MDGCSCRRLAACGCCSYGTVPVSERIRTLLPRRKTFDSTAQKQMGLMLKNTFTFIINKTMSCFITVLPYVSLMKTNITWTLGPHVGLCLADPMERRVSHATSRVAARHPAHENSIEMEPTLKSCRCSAIHYSWSTALESACRLVLCHGLLQSIFCPIRSKRFIAKH